MQALFGAAALSAFKSTNLLRTLQASLPNVTAVYSQHIHFVDCQDGFNASQSEELLSLLKYGDFLTAKVEPDQRAQNALQRLVVPRPGTISPWSSKATDILHNCGLQLVNRIERGTMHVVEVSSPLDVSGQAELDCLLHDRMTQSVLDEISEATLLFRTAIRAPRHSGVMASMMSSEWP